MIVHSTNGALLSIKTVHVWSCRCFVLVFYKQKESEVAEQLFRFKHLFSFKSAQCCDMGYHASLARTFRTYLSAEYNLETSRHEGLDIIENAVDNLDSRNDKHKIMDMHNQVFCPPMRFEYLPHMGDEVRDLRFFCLFSSRPPVLT